MLSESDWSSDPEPFKISAAVTQPLRSSDSVGDSEVVDFMEEIFDTVSDGGTTVLNFASSE